MHGAHINTRILDVVTSIGGVLFELTIIVSDLSTIIGLISFESSSSSIFVLKSLDSCLTDKLLSPELRISRIVLASGCRAGSDAKIVFRRNFGKSFIGDFRSFKSFIDDGVGDIAGLDDGDWFGVPVGVGEPPSDWAVSECVSPSSDCCCCCVVVAVEASSSSSSPVNEKKKMNSMRKCFHSLLYIFKVCTSSWLNPTNHLFFFFFSVYFTFRAN